MEEKDLSLFFTLSERLEHSVHTLGRVQEGFSTVHNGRRCDGCSVSHGGLLSGSLSLKVACPGFFI
jgi:hypothetical protein